MHAGVPQKRAGQAFVGLWQQDNPKKAAGASTGTGMQAQQNSSLNALPSNRFPSMGGAANTSSAGKQTVCCRRCCSSSHSSRLWFATMSEALC